MYLLFASTLAQSVGYAIQAEHAPSRQDELSRSKANPNSTYLLNALQPFPQKRNSSLRRSIRLTRNGECPCGYPGLSAHACAATRSGSPEKQTSHCLGNIRPQTRCSPIKVHLACLDLKKQPRGCPFAGSPALTQDVFELSVGLGQYTLSVHWTLPTRNANLTAGYLLTFNPDTQNQVCQSVPPCQTSYPVTRHFKLSTFGSCIDQYLPLPSLVEQYTSFMVTSLPVSAQGREQSSVHGKVRIPACQEFDWRAMSDLCKLMVANRPPQWSAAAVSHKLLNHSLQVSWTRPLCNLTIKGYRVKIEHSPVRSNRPPITLADVNPTVTAYEVTGLNSSQEYLVTLRAFANLNASTITDLRRVMKDAYDQYDAEDLFVANLQRGVGSYSFKITFGTDGQWSGWTEWSLCACDAHSNQTRSRQCLEPLPESGGLPCQGESVQKRVCTLGKCHSDEASRMAANNKTHATSWYSLPAFYITCSKAVVILLLAIHVTVRQLKKNHHHDTTCTTKQQSSSEGAEFDFESSAVIKASGMTPVLCTHVCSKANRDMLLAGTERKFSPPQAHLVISHGGDTNSEASDAHPNSNQSLELSLPCDSESSERTKVYISYSRSVSDLHNSNVLAFSNWLTHFSFNAILDKWYTISVGANIASWTEHNLVAADKVVVVLSSEYYFDWYSMENRPEEEERSSDRQACLEAKLIQTLMMESRCGNCVCVPVFLGSAYQRACLPAMLVNSAWFRLSEDDISSARSLVHYLHGIEEHQHPE